MRGIKLTLRDGTVEHFDPVPEIIINNTFYDYPFDTEQIDKLEFYDLEEEAK